MTLPEVKLWNWLRESVVATGVRFRRQAPLDRFIVDFACLRAGLVVEVDGGQHGSEVGMRNDAVRDRRLAELGYHALRFSNAQVDRENQTVLETIRANLLARCDPSPTPVGFADSPSPSGEGSPRLDPPHA